MAQALPGQFDLNHIKEISARDEARKSAGLVGIHSTGSALTAVHDSVKRVYNRDSEAQNNRVFNAGWEKSSIREEQRYSDNRNELNPGNQNVWRPKPGLGG